MSTATPVTVMVIGPPGAGKSSICAAIRSRYANSKSFAVRLRYESLLQAGHDLGIRIHQWLSGDTRYIAPDLISELFESFLAERTNGELVLLEGFPINETQVEIASTRLADVGRRIDRVLDLHVDERVAMERIAVRRVCPRCELAAVAGQPVSPEHVECPRCGGPLVIRQDDQSDLAKRRFADFAAERARILAAVPPEAVVRLDVSQLSVEDVIARAVAELGLEGDPC